MYRSQQKWNVLLYIRYHDNSSNHVKSDFSSVNDSYSEYLYVGESGYGQSSTRHYNQYTATPGATEAVESDTLLHSYKNASMKERARIVSLQQNQATIKINLNMIKSRIFQQFKYLKVYLDRRQRAIRQATANPLRAGSKISA